MTSSNSSSSSDLNLSIMFHWGIYSVPAFDDMQSLRKRKVQNASEWYLEHLHPKTHPDNTLSQKYTKTKTYHETMYGKDFDYFDFAEEFHPENANFDEWMILAKSCNSTEVLLTAKHHDGFCLFDTNTTEHKTKFDVLQKFKDCALKHGLKFGIYYSWFEFEKTPTVEYCKNIMIKQIQELITYEPSTFWFDGDWAFFKSLSANRYLKDCLQMIKEQNPSIQINDRVGRPSTVSDQEWNSYDKSLLADAQQTKTNLIKLNQQKILKSTKSNMHWLDKTCTFRVFDDKYIPESKPTVKWQHINTVSTSWGFCKTQEIQDYKTGHQLKETITKVCQLDGHVCLSMGPDPHGKLDPNEVQSLVDLSKLLNA